MAELDDRRRRHAVLNVVALVAALLLLNASLTFTNLWPTLGVRLSGDLSIELVLAVLGLVLVRRWRGAPAAAAPGWLAALWVVAIVGRYVDVTARSLYGRDLNLYWDLRFLPDVSAMFAFVTSPWLIAGVILVVALVPLAAYAGARWAFGRVNDAARSSRAGNALAVAAAGLLLFWIAERAGAPVLLPVRFAQPVSAVYALELGELAYEASGAGARSLPPSPAIRSDFRRVSGADVLLVFLESYGAVSWERPEFVRGLAKSRTRLEADIRETGRSVVSALVESTTFGGESWLAHISLLSGVEVRDQGTNVRLMAQERDTLVKAFGRRGYRTVAVMPGLIRAWPQGAFYGFDDIYDLSRLDYRGPSFGWWDINDQFTLARVDALEVLPEARQPLFLFLPTITTHAPFTPAPPYQADWARVLTPDPYDTADLDRAWSEQPDWLNLGPSYIQALSYVHSTLGGYLRLRADRDLVLIVVGDHQPPALVTGAGASWDVPIHVITTRRDVLDRLRVHRFGDGLAPRAPAVARMDTLLALLLDGFGDDVPLRASSSETARRR